MQGDQFKRRPDGTFAPGNGGGPGRPPDTALGQLRAIIDAEITPDEVRRVVRTLFEMAVEDRNHKAAGLLLGYRYGRPPVGVAMSDAEQQIQSMLGNELLAQIRSELQREQVKRQRAELDAMHGATP